MLKNSFELCLALLFICTAWTSAEAIQPGTSLKFAFTGASGAWRVHKTQGKIVAENSVTKAEKTVFADVEEETEVSHYEIASLAGPILSVAEELYWEGGAHPEHLTRLVTVNLDTGKSPVLLTELFPEELIVAALLKDKIIKKSLGTQHPQSIAGIIQSAEGGCEISYYELNESFAFHHLKGDKVAVRIGLAHGCEAMRGNYTELGIYLPKPPQLAEFLEQAKKRKTLQGDVRIRPGGTL